MRDHRCGRYEYRRGGQRKSEAARSVETGPAGRSPHPAVDQAEGGVGLRGRDQVVSGHEDRRAELGTRSSKRLDHLVRALGIDLCGWFIGEHDGRLARESDNETPPLLLTRG